MNNKKPFSHPRWRHNLDPDIVGYIERTEEEKRENKEKFFKHLKKIGVIKEDDEK